MTQPLPDSALHIRVSFLNPSSAKLPTRTDNNTSSFTRKAHHHQQQQQWQGADDIKTTTVCSRSLHSGSFPARCFYVTLTVNNLCVFLSELLRRCEEGDAAGEEPDRRSEEQDEANPEGRQPTLGEETRARSPHNGTL